MMTIPKAVVESVQDVIIERQGVCADNMITTAYSA